ncbi:AhpA/YtjB family protein [Psychromonas sp.]|uniref:AhpA/YtjB family protein n=1 Tax=Psychromonas sp. TaxID=1884585 RepID=UPI0035675996
MNKKMYYLLRKLQILSLLTICGIIGYQFMNLNSTSNAMRYQQTERFSYSLTNLAAAEASRYLAQQQNKNLQILIKDLTNDPSVRDAVIYDQFGNIIFQSEDALPLPILLNIDSSDDPRAKGVTPRIAELYKDNKKIGYIRISLEQQKLLSLISDYQKQSLSTMLLLFVLSFSAGTIIMALFFRKAEAAYYRLSAMITRLIGKNKEHTQY